MVNFGIIMDPISSINIKKDSSFAILLEAQKRSYKIYYMEVDSLYLHNNVARATAKLIAVQYDHNIWYECYDKKDINLNELDVILMRKDPPFNMRYVYCTYILDYAEKDGVLVINNPRSLRNFNEKLFISLFPNYMPDTLVSCCIDHIHDFYKKHKNIILKPLNKMGGMSVFYVGDNDPNLSVIIETLTQYGKDFCIVQSYLPDIQYGDKRILIIDGKPIPYCLARIPRYGEIRGNLASGGFGEGRKVNDYDLKIANDVALVLKKNNIFFAGIDIIGNKLTEINITSPTCIREIENTFHIPITSKLLDAIEDKILKLNTTNTC